MTLCCVCILAVRQPFDEPRLLQIAHQAIALEVSNEAPAILKAKSSSQPVFVTIERSGEVVGCRGSLVAKRPSLEEEVATDARAASMHDPRYRPISKADLAKILVTVTIVDRKEPISQVGEIVPADGLVLTSGGRVGVVLPWEGKDPETRLKWAYRKAGVSRSAPVTLFRLVATRFRG